METEVKSNSKAKIVLVILLLAIIGGVSWYFLYFIKTPVYSLNLVRESVQEHDVETFKKHVDLDNLLNKGFDDIIDAFIASEVDMKENAFAATFAKGLITTMKPALIDEFKENILDSVSGTSEVSSDVSDNKNNDKPTSIDGEKLSEKTGMKSADFKGVEYTKIDGKSAVVGIKIAEANLPNDYILDVKMHELEDGSWKIAEISNLKDYVFELDKARKIALKKYIDETKIITDKYNAELDKLIPLQDSNPIEFYQKYVENMTNCENELKNVALPDAAKELADTRTEFYAAVRKQTDLRLKKLNGDNSRELSNEISAATAEVERLSIKRNTIIKSVKNVQ